MKKFYVYVHVLPNGKRYVGATAASKPELRWKGGRGYGGIFLQDILKYGWDNITHDVFEVDSKEEMYRKEVELISFYHSNDPRYGYNHSMGGEKSSLGCKRSEETRRKISKARKKEWLDPEIRKKRSEALKKRAKDPEVQRKRSEAVKKKWTDPEYRKHLAEVAKNRPKIKIQLPDGTIIEVTKQILARDYVNKGKKFEYVP